MPHAVQQLKAFHIDLNPVNNWAPPQGDPLTNVRFERAWRAMSNLPEEWFPLTEEAMYYLSPEQAMRFEIIDEIVPMWDVDFDAGDGS